MAQPNGGFEGEAKFKLRFKSGGAIDFGTAMLKAAQMGKYSTFIPKNLTFMNAFSVHKTQNSIITPSFQGFLC